MFNKCLFSSKGPLHEANTACSSFLRGTRFLAFVVIQPIQTEIAWTCIIQPRWGRWREEEAEGCYHAFLWLYRTVRLRCRCWDVDGVFYYQDHNHEREMFGLDLSKPNNQPKRVVLGKSHKESRDCRWWDVLGVRFMVSLGNGKLAVLWEGTSDVEDHISVYCSVINMSKEMDGCSQVEFVAYPLSCSSYYLQGYMFHDCLAVWVKLTTPPA